MDFEKKLEVGKRIDLDDVLIMDAKMLSDLEERHYEMIDIIKENSFNSLEDFAEFTGRDKDEEELEKFMDDVGVLFKNGVIDFEKTDEGKAPVIGHENIIAIVYSNLPKEE